MKLFQFKATNEAKKINESINALREQIQINLATNDNRFGILKHKRQAYLSAMRLLQIEELESLFMEDLQVWGDYHS